jgi:hypothetical protein
MTTARERYEAKTKVVTFRVHQGLYEDLKRIKTETGLSFTDLIKLGAGIARDEIEAKIAEENDLRGRLKELREAVQTEKQRVADIAAKERQEQLGKLEHEIQAFRLFDLGWSIEEAKFKLGMSQAEVSQHFTDWATMRGEREKLQTELLKKCLQNYIARLREHIYYRAVGRDLEEAKQRLEHSQRMLTDPSKLTKEEKTLLISDYSYFL